MNKLVKALSSLLVAMLVAIALCGCNVPKDSLNANYNQFTQSWMANISDEALVKDIAIAGSNDAGLSTASRSAKTQHFTTGQQLDMGVRYLELNVRKKGDDLLAFYGSHTGESIDDVLAGVLAFLKAHNTETVILDFAGFNNQPQQQLLELIKKYFVPNGSYTYIVRNIATSVLDSEFFDTLTLSRARGRVIVFMDGDGNDYLDQQYIFKRNNSQGTRLFTALQSYCDQTANNKSSAKYIDTLDATLAKYAKANEGMCVLQGQLHDGTSLLGPAYYESKHASNMSQYVSSLADSTNLATVNVVTRNFVDCTKACQIIALNAAKGNVKADKANAFAQGIAEFVN